MAGQTENSSSKIGLLGEILRSGKLVWQLLRDPRVPLLNKLVIPGLFAAYLLWPADLLPDVLPVLGQVDELVLLALAVKLFINLSPADIVRQYRNDAGPHDPGTDASKDVVDAEYRVVK